jgi:hypothetical protein
MVSRLPLLALAARKSTPPLRLPSVWHTVQGKGCACGTQCVVRVLQVARSQAEVVFLLP